MRVHAVFLVALVTLLASAEAASAATRSSPTKLVQAAPNYDHTDTNSARFLRKREADEDNDLKTEERQIFANLYSKITNKNALKLFTKTNDQLAAKKYGPNKLFDALNLLKKSGIPEEKLAGFVVKAGDWSDHWYRSAGKLDPVRN